MSTLTIKLENQEYTFPFANPYGARAKCTLIKGAGTVTLYELVESLSVESTKSVITKVQTGNPYYLSNEDGRVYYVELNTRKRKSTWEIVFTGTGEFLLELTDRILPEGKRMSKNMLTKK